MDDQPESDSPNAASVAVILAAGMGTRMRSALPKVLHRAAGDPLVSHVIDAARDAGVSDVVLVVGHGRDLVKAAIGDSVRFVVQEPQLGTGHALQQTLKLLRPVPSRLVVLCGDAPLLTAASISRMLADGAGVTITVLSARVADPTGYGRIVRDETGGVRAIVEESDASEGERAITEINSGLYCFDGRWVAANLDRLEKSASGEYYLTDLVSLAVKQGLPVRAVLAEAPSEVMGVNDRIQLAEADRTLRERFCLRLLTAGVTVVDPAATYVGKDVSVGQDTVIHPGTHLRGRTIIGSRCEIGPNTIIQDAIVGDECVVLSSVIEHSRVADRVQIGPYSHLRPGADISSDAKLGNYAEVKNSSLGEGVQMHHFSYVGDAEVGAGTNVGAGTITCNFDGRTRKKYRTKIGKNVFLGSDTLLRAPVELGDGAQTGAGAVVTKDVPAGRLAVGMPARIRPIREPDGPGDSEQKKNGGAERGS